MQLLKGWKKQHLTTQPFAGILGTLFQVFKYGHREIPTYMFVYDIQTIWYGEYEQQYDICRLLIIAQDDTV